MFKTFRQAVKVESSGFHSGPSAAIHIGERFQYRGTRGVAMVAVVDRDIVLRGPKGQQNPKS